MLFNLGLKLALRVLAINKRRQMLLNLLIQVGYLCVFVLKLFVKLIVIRLLRLSLQIVVLDLRLEIINRSKQFLFFFSELREYVLVVVALH